MEDEHLLSHSASKKETQWHHKFTLAEELA